MSMPAYMKISEDFGSIIVSGKKCGKEMFAVCTNSQKAQAFARSSDTSDLRSEIGSWQSKRRGYPIFLYRQKRHFLTTQFFAQIALESCIMVRRAIQCVAGPDLSRNPVSPLVLLVESPSHLLEFQACSIHTLACTLSGHCPCGIDTFSYY